MKMDGWINTDPDNFQFGKQLDKFTFEFKEFDRHTYMDTFRALSEMDYEAAANKIIWEYWDKPEYWKTQTVNLRAYTINKIWEHVSCYYDSMDSLFETYGKTSSWIMAECIFEQESNLY